MVMGDIDSNIFVKIKSFLHKNKLRQPHGNISQSERLKRLMVMDDIHSVYCVLADTKKRYTIYDK